MARLNTICSYRHAKVEEQLLNALETVSPYYINTLLYFVWVDH